MKIIKRGTLKEKSITCACENCGCVISFKPNERGVKYFQDPRQDENGYELKCPQCKNDLFVSE